MPDTTCENNNEKHCCISHEFDRAASKAPNKVAVIHALGGSRIARGPRIQTLDSPFEVAGTDAGGFLGEGSDSPRPNPRPVSYDGDECFTFSDLLAAVDSLSFRLRRILDGGDDPQLIRPGGDICSKIPLNDQVSESLELCVSNLEHPIDMQNTVIPKILGVYMVPSAEYIIAVLSVLRCGEAFLPLDPSWPKERILSVVSSSNVDLILSCRSLCERNFHQQDNNHWLLGCIHCPVLFISMKGDLQECFLSPEICWPCESRNQRPFCYLMYTSGSTGEAKGVCGTEIGLLNRFFWMQESYPLYGEELLLFKTSISFIDHLQEFLASILTACTLVIPPFIDMKEKPFYVVDFLQLYSINRLVAVPSLIRAILPALESTLIFHIQDSLKLLVLSGETLSLPLWSLLSKLLPKATILNFYGSTEVSGDCTYFDCKRLPLILETESVSSVPIGKSIANCDVVLYGDNDTPDQGEICVDGMCVSGGYIYGSSRMPLDNVKLCSASLYSNSTNECGRQYFRTGDYGRRLQSGDLVFIGRKDRTVKINGHRIALEEIENTLRMHPDIVDAAVIFCECEGEVSVLKAFIVSKQKTGYSENLRSSIRSWMIDRISLAMIPRQLIFMETFPLSSTGKVDYVALAEQASMTPVQDEKRKSESSDLLESIKKAFCTALVVENVSDDDDFFVLGGNSIGAAQVSYCLKIDMRMLYNFPSPSRLLMILQNKKYLDTADSPDAQCSGIVNSADGNLHNSVNLEACNAYNYKLHEGLLGNRNKKDDDYSFVSKRLKMDQDVALTLKEGSQRNLYLWNSNAVSMSCSFSRCNKVLCEGEHKMNDVCQATWSAEFPSNGQNYVKKIWKVHMDSCVDASPIIVFKSGEAFLLIGSHSHRFLCVSAKSGAVQWEVELEGRIECSAAVVGDFSQVIVGCYEGKIYFLDFLNGSICWSFQTLGEVKSQPLVDVCRNLVWCGSHDHNLYALDYRNYHCAYKLPCGGSIYGSPAIDEVRQTLYVASTSGCVTALSVKDLEFKILWKHELEVPVFGSLSIGPLLGSIICCLVDGHVVALDPKGSIIWKVRTGGPIFAGCCLSHVLPSQVLICSRNGIVYSFQLETGSLLWEYNVGDPITASAYVDENFKFPSPPSHLSDRLVCICTSSGSIYMLRINLYSIASTVNNQARIAVHEFAKLNLEGDIFSSPVMIAGRLFVGCRDDYVHCIGLVPPV